MDDLISLLFEFIQEHPVLSMIVVGGYIASILLKAKNSGGDGEDTSVTGSDGNGDTWEDMEREYGIRMERKSEDVLPPGSTDTDEDVKNTAVVDTSVLAANSDTYADSDAYTKDGAQEQKRQNVLKQRAVSALVDRLAQYNARSAARLSATVPAHADTDMHRDDVLRRRVSKRQHMTMSAREGMKWAVIFGRPKALERRY